MPLRNIFFVIILSVFLTLGPLTEGRVSDEAHYVWTNYYDIDISLSAFAGRSYTLRKIHPEICKEPREVLCLNKKTGATFVGLQNNVTCDLNGLTCGVMSACNNYRIKYLCPKADDECALKTASCDGSATCVNMAVGYKCVCPRNYIKVNNRCHRAGHCIATGDPHLTTFDGSRHHIVAPCKYVFAKVCEGVNVHGMRNFTVYVTNTYRRANASVSLVSEAELQLGEENVKLQRDGVVKINDYKIAVPAVVNLGDVKIHVKRRTDKTQLLTDFGLRIEFDGRSRLAIGVTSTYAGHMCGICGNFDGNSTNDWSLPGGNLTDQSNTWAAAWMAKRQSNPSCTKSTLSFRTSPPDCSESAISQAQTKCNILKGSLFAACHSHVSVNRYYEECVNDTCADLEGSPFCSSVKNYALECEKANVRVRWRTAANCAPTCGPNSHFEEYTTGCENTCNNPDEAVQCTDGQTEGCVCNEGFVLSDKVCVRESDCGCQLGQSYFPRNATWMANNCTETKKCIGRNTIGEANTIQCHQHGWCRPTVNQAMACLCRRGFSGTGHACFDLNECDLNSHNCDPHAKCENTFGSYRCKCKEGYKGDGFQCIDVDECVEGTATCGANSICINIDGNYTCQCQPGYAGNGRNCERERVSGDVLNANNCSFHQTETCNSLSWCQNTGTGFICHCPAGTTGDGKIKAKGTGCSIPDCPPGWTMHKLECYKFSSRPSRGDDPSPCTSIGGHGATITDVSTLSFLTQKVQTTGGNVWMGYRFLPSRGNYFPLDFSATNYWTVLWAPGEPVYNASKPCVSFSQVSQGVYKLTSKSCATKEKHLCKRPRIPTHTCPDGWKYLDGRCYTSFNKKLPFDEAVLECAKYDADPVKIKGSKHEQFLMRSYYQHDEFRTWLGLVKRNGSTTWFDGSQLSYVPQIYESGVSASQLCVSAGTDGNMTFSSCTEKFKFICEKESDVPHRCPMIMNDITSYFNGKCYTPTTTKTPFTEGHTNCEKDGRELAAITSRLEQEFLETHLKTLKMMDANFPSAWIGLKRTNGTMLWNGKKSVTYTNWMSNQPKSKVCGYVQNQNLKLPWGMSDCDKKRFSICEYEPSPCRRDSECHSKAICHNNHCRCKPGFFGTGKQCDDVNECVKPVCKGQNEVCVNNIGSYSCACIRDHIRDSFNVCRHIRYCAGDAECANAGNTSVCLNNLCYCRPGYRGDGKARCTDINECVEGNACDGNATCTNHPGTYSCQCNAGFKGNGFKCKKIPQTCEEIRLKDISKPSGRYEIDPDGPGPAQVMEVECDMRPDIGITIIHHDGEYLKPVTQKAKPDERPITYPFPVNDIRLIVTASAYCYQYIQYRCVKSKLFGNGYYVGYDNKQYKRWGGSEVDNQCICGSINRCFNYTHSCNCDGDDDFEKIDEGRISNKDHLPVIKIVNGGEEEFRKAKTRLWPLKCGPRIFDVYKNCQEVKDKLNEPHDGPQLIDVDGPNGPLQPFFVFCNMQSYDHTAVTEVPQNKNPGRNKPYPGRSERPLNPSDPGQPGDNPIKYLATPEQINKLIDDSPFCLQEVNYTCTNSRILNGNGHLVAQRAGNLSFWAGGTDNNCACGTLKYCEDKTAHCNCDIRDGRTRKDFGFITTKEHLPIVNIVLNDVVGAGKSGIIAVGNLQCAQLPFGTEPSCQEWADRGYRDSSTYMIDPDGPKKKETEKGNVDPFRVHCEISDNPMAGYTIVPVAPPQPGQGTTPNPGTGPPGTGPPSTGPPGTGPPGTGPPGSGPPGTGTTTPSPFGNSTTEQPTTTPPMILIPLRCNATVCSYDPTYPTATKPQLEKLTQRSSACYQTLKISCVNTALISPNVSSWIGQRNISHKYFDGSNDSLPYCRCQKDGSCPAGCFCASNASSYADNGLLEDKDHLPMYHLYLNAGLNVEAGNTVELGDLVCSEIFPDCDGYHRGYVKTIERKKRSDYGPYTIDPDGQFGLPPFQAYCKFPRTIIEIPHYSLPLHPKDPNVTGKEANCTELNYFQNTTIPQLRGLTIYSNYCIQYAQYQCKDAPLTDYVSLYNANGSKIPGWAGNNGGDKCPCGVLGKCDGGPSQSCNCDSGGKHIDHGIIIDKTILPLTKVCAGLPETGKPNRFGKWAVSHLECGPKPFDLFPDCQALAEKIEKYRFFKSLRNRFVDHTWIIDPDLLGPIPPLLVHCEITKKPRVGVTVIPPKTTDCIESTDQVTAKYKYHYAEEKQLEALKNSSTYAEQGVTYDCNNAPLTLDGNFGPYGVTNTSLLYWADNTNGTGCVGGSCNCDKSDNTNRSDNGNFLDMNILPISQVKLAAVTSSSHRRLCLKDLRLFRIYKTCEHIRLAEPERKDGIYPIDPDQAGGLKFFGVKCDFRRNIGISMGILKKVSVPGVPNNPQSKPVTYTTATPEQLQGLTKVSDFCYQDVWFYCKHSRLLADQNTYLRSYDGVKLHSWGGADLVNETGCACSVLESCPKGDCHCNKAPALTVKEGGRYTTKELLPISQVNMEKNNINTLIQLDTLKCGPKPFDMPRDCNEASKKYIFTSEFEALILPRGEKKPLLVRCKFLRKSGKSYIPVIYLEPKPVPKPNSTQVDVHYIGVTPDQIKSIVKSSKHCVQMVKMTCKNAKLSNAWSFKGGIADNEYFFFGSSHTDRRCSCGDEQKCATDPADSISGIKARQCSCDLGDNTVRYDAGTMTRKDDLPISSYHLENTAGSLSLQLGGLMCGHTKFDVDECKSGFHDCDRNAECRNTATGYECDCKLGWNGLHSKQPYATGRTCVDDNECERNPCMPHSDCNNTLGSYECICHSGYRMSGKYCVDIDECAENSHDCDVNANCYNTDGSFKCMCKKGFQGAGKRGQCESVGVCECWGDPHCNSFDGRWLNYQGACKYTMVRDNCLNGLPNTKPNFEVVQKNWRRNVKRKVSWVKEVTVHVAGDKILLKAGHEVAVNDQKVYLPYPFGSSSSATYKVTFAGKDVVLKTNVGLTVYWDGNSVVRTEVTSVQNGTLCGLCGNFNHNPEDDWIIGNACRGRGEITSNRYLFGDSWRRDNPRDTDGECEPSCRYHDPVQRCNMQEVQTARTECNRLTEMFKDCAPYMNMTAYIEGCTFDICETKTTSETLCRTAETIAKKCFEDHHITVTWRSNNFCQKQCGKDMVYEASVTPCQPTCDNPNGSTVCNLKPQEMCICKEGLLLMDGKCITPQQCGCVMNSTYYPVNTTFITENCTHLCSCRSANAAMDCRPKSCHEHATCSYKENIRDCYCIDGLMGDGEQNCTDINECENVTSPCHAKAVCNNTFANYTCTCLKGYQGDGKTCDNINECKENATICNTTTEECHDTDGSYECRCAAGFMRSSVTGKCEDKDECNSTNNECHVISTHCNNTFGGYLCTCKTGFVRVNAFTCRDVNECKEGPPPCHKDATCRNTLGGHICKCKEGFLGDGKNCTDINECDNQVCYRDARCENLPGSFQCYCTTGKPGCQGPDPCVNLTCGENEICRDGSCRCKDGFQKNPATKKCENINECETRQDDCLRQNKTCIDSIGSYYCKCLKGFIQVGDRCEDEDECATGSYECSKNAKCVNKVGGYLCMCKDGYTGSCDECRDIDECYLGYCNGPNHQCTNTDGSYKCDCLKGFQRNELSNKTHVECIDTNECMHGIANCSSSLMRCVNVPGSYICQCPGGYSKTADGRCQDDNECLTSVNQCHLFAQCINLEGSYKCKCNPGYHGDGTSCFKDPDIHLKCGDIKCHPKAHCKDDISCVCNQGYSGNGTSCDDVNECTQKVSPCDQNAVCVNLPGTVACRCKDNYHGNGFICNKKDAVDLCDKKGFCVNGESCEKSTCKCPVGYRLNGTICININECKEKQPCKSSVCIDTIGSYKCQCSSGQTIATGTGDQITCEDVNECDSNICGPNRVCNNLFGSYSCKCPDGMRDVFSDATHCVRPNNNCSVMCPKEGYCEGLKCVCPPGFQLVKDENNAVICNKSRNMCGKEVVCTGANMVCSELYNGAICECKAGYRLVGQNACEDVDECVNHTANCNNDDGQVCVNSAGSYTCQCTPGLILVNGKCQSKNVCTCGRYGFCLQQNTTSVNRCHCYEGYEENNDNVCVDINECERKNPCHIFADCTNKQGSYKCRCKDGFKGDGQYVCDRNECLNNPCPANTVCRNKVNGYECACLPPFTRNERSECVEAANPCLVNNGGCPANANCINRGGRADCRCYDGFERGPTVNLTCVDINECERTNDCHVNAACNNYPGGYTCACTRGYRGNGKRCRDIDECSLKRPVCAENALCTNSIGSFSCACKQGYRGVGRLRCEVDRNCTAQGSCHPLAKCRFKDGIYKCVCNKGYEGNGKFCEDANECLVSTSCGENAQCNNTVGSFTCSCKPGFQGNAYSKCFDVDECAKSSKNNCDKRVHVCQNLPGSYKCSCNNGTIYTGTECKDIDECSQVGTAVCPTNAACKNTIGGFKCNCQTGSVFDNGKCVDVDECKMGLANCSVNTMCVNKDYSFDCVCQSGYKNDNENCTDVDECDDETLNKCDPNANCTNKDPGYTCECNEGYIGNGFTCVLKDPCSSPTACQPNATCHLHEGKAVCICKDGFIQLNYTKCVPADECILGTHNCNFTSETCIDKEIGFTCACKKGYKKEGNKCVDKNECDPSLPEFVPECGGSGGGCVNTEGAYSCVCPPSMAADKNLCVQKNECKETPNICGPNEKCKDKDPGYECVCKYGYRKSGGVCVDIDECAENNYKCYDNSFCKNIAGSYVCKCNPGFKFSLINNKCEDLNECQTIAFPCGSNGICVNGFGSYSCTCLEGYQWNATSNSCEDINECETPSNPCHEFAECSNVPGSCKCKCRAGTTGDGFYCEEIDNCTATLRSMCPSNSICIATSPTVPTCKCKHGFATIPNTPSHCRNGNDANCRLCHDIDECITRKSRCHSLAKCTNNAGYYQCSCPPNLKGNGFMCEDINECDEGTHRCDLNSTSCVNKNNTVSAVNYACECKAGFTRQSRTTCANIDDCKKSDVSCPANSRCRDGIATYYCDCNPGYKKENGSCVDIDECTNPDNVCDITNSNCHNVDGAYLCVCKTGFINPPQNRTVCVNVNECDHPRICKKNATCIDTIGSYRCNCNPGYRMDRGLCLDVDECATNKHDCRPSAKCENTVGAFTCSCKAGYEMSASGDCVDVNECIQFPQICGNNATCVNNNGSYDCSCETGFKLANNEKSCIDIDECIISAHSCDAQSYCYNTYGSYMCLCRDGFRKENGVCIDINECNAHPVPCAPGKCINSLGNYRCECPTGYKQNENHECIDINECSLSSADPNAHNCGLNEDCFNTEGSYRCSCKKGFQMSGGYCSDINECSHPNMCKNGQCQNTIGSFDCVCRKGWEWGGDGCIDVNECERIPGICGQTGSDCLNSVGSYKCLCQKGFKQEGGDTQPCEGIDWCADNPNKCGDTATCVSLTDRYTCKCKQGYTKNNRGICVNINECTSEIFPCPMHAECTDTIGSYTCTCKKGYTGSDPKVECNAVCRYDTCPSHKTCEVQADNTARCTCKCDGEVCDFSTEVCGSDGNTYPSGRHLFEASCTSGVRITASYYRPCQRTCDGVVCPPHKPCQMVSVTGHSQLIPQCKCQDCTAADRNSGPVCTKGRRPLQYDSVCHLKTTNCQLSKPHEIAYHGTCKRAVDCKWDEWSSWSSCSLSCGIGTKFRIRSIKRKAKFGGKCEGSPSEVEKCSNGFCRDVNTSIVCPPYAWRENNQCVCPICLSKEVKRVCAEVEGSSRTWDNICQLKKYACERQANISAFHEGACGAHVPESPVNCTLVILFKNVTRKGCRSAGPVQVNQCGGGCGKDSAYCCNPSMMENQMVEFICPDQSRVINPVQSIRKCKCTTESRHHTITTTSAAGMV